MATIPFRINGYDKSTIVVKNNRRGMLRFENVSVQVSQHSAFAGAYFTIKVTSIEQVATQTREILFEYDIAKKETIRFASKFGMIQKIDFIYLQPGEAVTFSCFAILDPQSGTSPLLANWQITGLFDDQFLVLQSQSEGNSSVFVNPE